MKVILASLLGLTASGGAVVPTISNSNNTVKIINNQESKTESQWVRDINLGYDVKLNTDQNWQSWTVNIEWNNSSQDIHQIKFAGGGLTSYAAWGNDAWTVKWDHLDVIPDAKEHVVQHDVHSDGMAEQVTHLTYALSRVNANNYTFYIHFATRSAMSFTGSYGSLTIGNRLTCLS